MEGAGDFTFAVAAPLAGSGGRRVGAGLLYPVFGQPRSPPRQRALETETTTTTATARVPLGRLLLVDALRAGAEQQPDGGDYKPAKTCCSSWCPGSPSTSSSSARCRKSGSTGSVLRWSQRLLGRSHSDGKEKFVFLDASPSNCGSKRKGVRSCGTHGAGGLGGHAHVWSSYAHKGGGNDGRRRSFLPYRQDLVGLFASATAFRRSYHPF